jgi:addiction module RelE/StbE family toxin
MIEISFSSSFKRAFRKHIKRNIEIEDVFWKCASLFINNPFDKKLKTHKLTGNLKELWSFTIEFDLRVIFYFTDSRKKAVFIDIGTHDEVY